MEDILASWCARASIGTADSRNRFRQKELHVSSNLLEILYRVIRGDRTYPNALNRLESGFGENLNLPASLQMPSVLAVSSIIDIAVDFAKQALGASGREVIQRRINEVIGKLPTVQLHRALDAMFREYRG